MKEFIIDNKNLKTTFMRYRCRAIFLSGWLIWFNLFMPMLSVYSQKIEPDASETVATFLLTYSSVFLIFMVIIFLWQQYWIFRFRGKEKRRNELITSNEEIADYFGVSTEDLQQWRQGKCLKIHIGSDEKGKIEKVDIMK
jgi:poly-beta-1,6-N-acetyl-D-glucosamine biosynthesis protein PgaD